MAPILSLFRTSARRSLVPNLNRRYPIPRVSIMPLSTHSVPKLNDPTLFQPYPFINNTFLPSSSRGETFTVNDPSTGDVIATLPDQTPADASTAIDAASAAFKTFKNLTPRTRSRMIRKWYDLMLQHKDDLAVLISWENGKPLADAQGEVTYAASFLEWFSEEAPRIYGDTIPVTNPHNRVFTKREPVGVCGLITPWNFPAAMITRKAAPALAAGCTVVVKAPSETPMTALALAELAKRAGIPEGVLNVVTTEKYTKEVGKELCTNPIIKKISFTGSTGVGKVLMEQASGTLKKCSFELGGNAPFIVFDDADLEKAVDGAITAKYRSSGQTCVCANRIYVQSSIYDKFSTLFTQKVSSLSLGSPFNPSTTHGPLIHSRALDKVHAHVTDALSHGATLHHGGRPSTHLGPNFYPLTVLTDMEPHMAIHREETFGPVAALFKFETEKEVVELANSAEVGLAAYFWSSDVKRVWRVAEALEVGMVGVNTGLISDPASPFGGVKQSGFGREGGSGGIDEFLVVKTVTVGGVGELEG